MPIIGEVKKGTEIGYRSEGKHMWLACEKCGKERWVHLDYGKPHYKICRICALPNDGRNGVIYLGTIENPALDDIRHGKDIGKGNFSLYIWRTCGICGKGRWIQLRNKSVSKLCWECNVHKYDKRNHCKYLGTVRNPVLGDVRHGRDIGHEESRLYIWHVCEMCGRKRWAQYFLKTRSPIHTICDSCGHKLGGLKLAGEKNPHWKGKRRVSGDYVVIVVSPDNPFYAMSTKSRNCRIIPEHRLVMAQYLGRCLESKEVIHHKNGIKYDNRIENLELLSSRGEHSRNHNANRNSGYIDGYTQGLTDGRNKQIRDLKLEIIRLNEKIRQQEQLCLV